MSDPGTCWRNSQDYMDEARLSSGQVDPMLAYLSGQGEAVLPKFVVKQNLLQEARRNAAKVGGTPVAQVGGTPVARTNQSQNGMSPSALTSHCVRELSQDALMGQQHGPLASLHSMSTMATPSSMKATPPASPHTTAPAHVPGPVGGNMADSQALLYKLQSEVLRLYFEEEAYAKSCSPDDAREAWISIRFATLSNALLAKAKKDALREGPMLLSYDRLPSRLLPVQVQAVSYMLLRSPGWMAIFPELRIRLCNQLALSLQSVSTGSTAPEQANALSGRSSSYAQAPTSQPQRVQQVQQVQQLHQLHHLQKQQATLQKIQLQKQQLQQHIVQQEAQRTVHQHPPASGAPPGLEVDGLLDHHYLGLQAVGL
eukprot:TRINITY_DN24311_c0_g1_i3.p1 TRINITY_DN24311_c0_g1~~TRINITY_DN24311_c0_g1_i3.p1  ORF type:complete len:370 (-),score=89.96 TRINITY_DN24311_c0_g1_i3:116-1225(-)